jgi:hypothetical protein
MSKDTVTQKMHISAFALFGEKRIAIQQSTGNIDIDKTRYWLNHGIDIEYCQHDDGMTALLVATQDKNVELVRLFVVRPMGRILNIQQKMVQLRYYNMIASS